MYRSKTTGSLIKYLNKKTNCDNVLIDIIKNNKTSAAEIGRQNDGSCVIDLIQCSYKIINYNSNAINNSDKQESTIISTKNANKLILKYDFMGESNHTGFEYFPYLYGVLDCKDKEYNTMYVFYEYFEKSLGEIIRNIEHPSEWYDICFQLINIDNYLVNIKSKNYSCSLKNIMYSTNNNKILKTYNINNKIYKINHKYTIVLWDFEFSDNNKSDGCVQCFYKYISANDFQEFSKNTIKPSPRVMTLLQEYITTQSMDEILVKYFS